MDDTAQPETLDAPDEHRADWPRWHCLHCDHYWHSRSPDAPKPRQCAGCRSAYWESAPVRKRKPKAPKPPVISAPVNIVRGYSGSAPRDLEYVSDFPLAPPPHLRIERYMPADTEPRMPENAIRRPVDDWTNSEDVDDES